MGVDVIEKVIIGNDKKKRHFKIVAKDKSISYVGYAKYAEEDFEEMMKLMSREKQPPQPHTSPTIKKKTKRLCNDCKKRKPTTYKENKQYCRKCFEKLRFRKPAFTPTPKKIKESW